jgi:hypothetical protein
MIARLRGGGGMTERLREVRLAMSGRRLASPASEVAA